MHSSVVERGTAVPSVIGSNPIVPFDFFQKRKEIGNQETTNRKRGEEENKKAS